MDTTETRRARLKQWFADRSLPEKEKSYLSQLINGKASFGEKAARRIEGDYGMPNGYLDLPVNAVVDIAAPVVQSMLDRVFNAASVKSGAPVTTAALARMLGETPQTISNWKTRGIPKDKWYSISVCLGVSVEWLVSGGDQVPLQSRPPEKGNLSKDYLRHVIAVDDSDPIGDDEVVIPCLRLKLSAGTGRLEWEVDPSGKPNRYRKEWIQRRNFTANKLVTMHVAGDSMSPGLPDGCLVTIDQAVDTPRSGKRHAIDYMGEFFIKRLFRQPDGSILVRSDNPDKIQYADWVVPYDKLDALKVLGLIVHVQLDTDG